MKKTFNIDLPDQFLFASVIAGVPPEKLIQAFVDALVLPTPHYMPTSVSIAAGEFFVEYANTQKSLKSRYPQQQLMFLAECEAERNKLYESLRDVDDDEREKALQAFFKLVLVQWRKLKG